MEHVYLDNAATTPVAPQVVSAMTTALNKNFGNASTPNFYGRQARAALDQARMVIAKQINAQENEIVFTSGGSEGDNTAIIQTALKQQHLGKHIITTAIEHEAVLKSMQYLEQLGFEVTYLPVDQKGYINLSDLKKALRPETILVSIMMVNNEVGVINPIKKIGQILQKHQAIFHTDAVQAFGHQSIDVQDLGVDLLTTSAHKLNGPKMIGFMYERSGLSLPPFIKGGDQETKRRAGTENVPAIVGFQVAVELHDADKIRQDQERLMAYKQRIIQELTNNGVEFAVNGPKVADGAPNILNLWIKGWSTSVLQIKLDLAGVIISGGSACTAGSLEPSHVLSALFGADSQRVNESIRISFDTFTSESDILKFTDILSQIVQ
ncbi:cysteine desulfurase [Bombilactobacillus folatiphilus]|uniref:Cysteine desulfurase n=1 Tax=Bombilactobacillus folatiphilus TaxID=2923362 RepID=A0ABY4PAU0_9LACO|nr:cysteine desulfurase family protein [Bombilactobacillus folatiphilus]UQS82717.1 cysteine desulfurase [Bombilactobacillus folatiphilus]